jgi:hypothetical protein
MGETVDGRQELGFRKQETVDSRRETGAGIQDSGFRKQKAALHA